MSYIDIREQALAHYKTLEVEIDAVGHRLRDTIVDGGTLYVVGNGGSLSQAEHFAGEVYRRKVVALTNPATITAIGNDFGFDYIFSNQLLCAGPNDIVLMLTTSGRSDNILEARNELDGTVEVPFVLLTGDAPEYWDDYNPIDEIIRLGDFPTPVVQEMTLIALHRWADIINGIVS